MSRARTVRSPSRFLDNDANTEDGADEAVVESPGVSRSTPGRKAKKQKIGWNEGEEKIMLELSENTRTWLNQAFLFPMRSFELCRVTPIRDPSSKRLA